MTERVHNFRLPIFDPCNVWLVVTDSVGLSRAKRERLLGKSDGLDYSGLMSYDSKGKFFIFLRMDAVSHDIIAHEVFHATVRMLEHCCHAVHFDRDHEPHAYLCGFLTKLVYRDLKRWGVKIKT